MQRSRIDAFSHRLEYVAIENTTGAHMSGNPYTSARAKPEPCNLQSFEIDQRIERGDGQSFKDRDDVPTHIHTQKENAAIRWGEGRGESVNQAISQCA